MAIDKTPGIRYFPLPWDPGTKTEIGTATSTRKKSQYHVLLRACVYVCVMCKLGIMNELGYFCTLFTVVKSLATTCYLHFANFE